MANSAEENLQIKRWQLQKRDVLTEIAAILKTKDRKEQELEQLKINLAEAKRVLQELETNLEGKEYKGNT